MCAPVRDLRLQIVQRRTWLALDRAPRLSVSARSYAAPPVPTRDRRCPVVAPAARRRALGVRAVRRHVVGVLAHAHGRVGWRVRPVAQGVERAHVAGPVLPADGSRAVPAALAGAARARVLPVQAVLADGVRPRAVRAAGVPRAVRAAAGRAVRAPRAGARVARSPTAPTVARERAPAAGVRHARRAAAVVREAVRRTAAARVDVSARCRLAGRTAAALRCTAHVGHVERRPDAGRVRVCSRRAARPHAARRHCHAARVWLRPTVSARSAVVPRRALRAG